ncbi:uncharacterized protein P174DRAFT_131411 [Aspergillus novofumigatus IBT 16806]|uniref:Uncharacterized protein n=1 Tax=Aspergillus novofumigatus (strain IBT 16806) TaxID=1392255 RepID=A0A2I1CCL4_ASPN1|nr:uncharacterized protein P174DRAFT_131411 [Aspergillus novofumigatus IBT 16806]PKX95359.1 hypothetical protein P174DRAFT_131411 [Aspergillus novofumigatus IBT 16806]
MANWRHGVRNHCWGLGLERLYINNPHLSGPLDHFGIGVFALFFSGLELRILTSQCSEGWTVVIVIACCSALVTFVQPKLRVFHDFVHSSNTREMHTEYYR